MEGRGNVIGQNVIMSFEPGGCFKSKVLGAFLGPRNVISCKFGCPRIVFVFCGIV